MTDNGRGWIASGLLAVALVAGIVTHIERTPEPVRLVRGTVCPELEAAGHEEYLRARAEHGAKVDAIIAREDSIRRSIEQ